MIPYWCRRTDKGDIGTREVVPSSCAAPAKYMALAQSHVLLNLTFLSLVSLSLVSTIITVTDRYTHGSAGCLTRREDPVVKQEEADQEPERHRRTPMPELEHSSLVGLPRIHDQRRAVGEHHDVARRADLCYRSALFTASTILAV